MNRIKAKKNTDKSINNVRCNLCGADDYKVIYKAGAAQIAKIVTCNHCGLMYANPREKVGIDEIQSWDPNFDVLQNPYWRLFLEKEKIQVRDYINTRREMNKLFPNRGELLEIGSSFGIGLNKWKQLGWKVTGIEPWQYGAEYTKNKFHINVIPNVLKTAAFENNKFDIVVMFHVIEHLPDPISELKEIFRILKPGGRFICETPRYDTIMFKLLGKRERSISCDGHIYFFTLKTLQEMCKKAGLKTESVSKVGRSLTIQNLFRNLGAVSKSKEFESILVNISEKMRISRERIFINIRDMQRIVFIKED